MDHLDRSHAYTEDRLRSGLVFRGVCCGFGGARLRGVIAVRSAGNDSASRALSERW